MYFLKVYIADGTSPSHIEQLERANDVVARIPELIREHGGCSKVVVQWGAQQLFAVDHQGEPFRE